jgi:hypothetical protein
MNVVITYAALGIALLGASHSWTHRGWAIYSLLFPIHALCISLAKDLWPFVKAILHSLRYNKTLHKLAVFIVTVYILWLFSSQ